MTATTAAIQPSTTRGPLPSATVSTTASVVDETTSPQPRVEAQPLVELEGLDVNLVAEGLRQPVHVTAAPGDDGRLFVVERFGRIRVIEDGLLLEEPFLDVTNQLLSNSIEQGLLGLVFHPGYEENGRLFVYYTEQTGNSRLAEFAVSPDPNRADASSQEILFTIDQPAERHNAGMLVFGPDGNLWIAVGDGGDGGSHGQDTSNPLGAILRVTIGDEPGSWTVPADNPLEEPDDRRIWASGLRNPWRFTIDPVDRLLYIGDVGQDRFEEINIVSMDSPGADFGWFEVEGDRCFRSGCELEQYDAPALVYSQDEGCSVTGGVVYRGALIPEFVGHYFYADWCRGWIRSFRYADGVVLDEFDWSGDFQPGQVSSFGTDNDGEMFVTNWDGQILQIVAVRAAEERGGSGSGSDG